jgi:hypothetical protein
MNDLDGQRYRMLAQYLTAIYVSHDEFEKTPDYINSAMERLMNSAREYDEKLIPKYLLKQSEIKHELARSEPYKCRGTTRHAQES